MMTDWECLAIHYENADFNDPETRNDFRKDFDYASKLYWEEILKDKDISAEYLATMWCSGFDGFKNIKDIYDEAYAYLAYASDRMNINRWLRIRILINYDVH